MKTGLTLGKYAPFHKGHQLVVETALAEVDNLYLIIYDCPETTQIPLQIRGGWIAKLYPEVRIIQAWDGAKEVGDSTDIRQKHENYIIGKLGIKGITHFYSSEFYGKHMSRALCAENRVVDEHRETIPVCGTQIRENPFAHRRYLHPLVYRDMVANLVFLGAPGTGKTTLAQALSKEYRTRWMPEYGRGFWEKYQKNRRLTPGQLEEIAATHLQLEEKYLQKSERFLFTDTNALTTYVFSMYYHGMATDALAALALQSAGRYDLVFLCDMDFPCPDTWDRSGEANRKMMQRRTIAELCSRKIPFIRVSGSIETRIRYVKQILKNYQKFMNLCEISSLQSGL